LGIGRGGAATFGAMLHAVNHSLIKAALFLVAGNIHAAYKTKSTAEVRGVFRVLPASGLLWIAGFFAVTGSPPFGPFLSEFTILKAALDQGHGVIAVAYLALLALIFIGMAGVVLRMAQGKPSSEIKTFTSSEAMLAVVPPGLLAATVLVLGVYIPPFISTALHDAAQTLGGF
jgi:hydrogenase-4 component F